MPQDAEEFIFAEKVIGFVDVLGFSNLVAKAEAGDGIGLPQLLELLKAFGSPDERDKFAKRGPMICPQSSYNRKDLDFRVTQISDCVVVSSEVSPAGAISLLNHCWVAVIRLLQAGVMCRGYVTIGRIFHTDTQVIGTGYQRAYQAERNVTAFKREADERGTPFVEVDKIVCEYINNCGNACAKEMFSRMAKADGETVALFPFKRLAHSFVISGHRDFDADKERRSNENVRTMINRFKDQVGIFVDKNNPAAVVKAAHYLRSLDAQLLVCDQTEAFLNQFDSRPSGQTSSS
jgi:hypothetical protein